jgi:hypothetical protein
MGALNHSERDPPSVAGSPGVAVARLFGGALARFGTLPVLMFTLLNDDLDSEHCLP